MLLIQRGRPLFESACAPDLVNVERFYALRLECPTRIFLDRLALSSFIRSTGTLKKIITTPCDPQHVTNAAGMSEPARTIKGTIHTAIHTRLQAVGKPSSSNSTCGSLIEGTIPPVCLRLMQLADPLGSIRSFSATRLHFNGNIIEPFLGS